MKSFLILIAAATATLTKGFKFTEEFNSLDNWVQPQHSKFVVDVASVYPGIDKDTGLVAADKATHYSIHSPLSPAIHPTHQNTPFLLQYQVKLQDGLDCGGAYIKLFSENIHSHITPDTPYSIMFGPDKCGFTNKVHFIFTHLNPITGEYTQHHLTQPPPIKQSKTSSLYTLSIHPDNSFHIFINGDKARSGSLLTDFDPPVNPPHLIHDPHDSKPGNWVEHAVIPDPSATKPDDWDESQPPYIPDPHSPKPENWRQDLPTFIPDPAITQPQDWNEEEDGEFVPPLIPNPDCENLSGCGTYTPPNIPNPLYKGPWTPPSIVNPDYKGPWSPRKIENPDYFLDNHPHALPPVYAVGFEIWSMSAGILFDNIFIGDDERELAEFTKATYAITKPIEEAREREALEATIDDDVKVRRGLISIARSHLVDFVDRFNTHPLDALRERWDVASVLAACVAVVLTLLTGLLGVLGGASSTAPKAPVKPTQVKMANKLDKKAEKADKADTPTTTKATANDAHDANLTKRR
ncbi:Calnexin-like protein [Wallemia ichthyophaga EXF-994]|uniref:Calnexin-like protein n=1 Tax=Wallemia ichthyophaga (strain EXF-994 / CBS 113033) TaxID=1299270 RepID=R9AIB0_WALI9|nr:Calnexin-like protein [Wallemia ichthyophaga EXF-994]EOR01850.1 Calnexin-like protein [Wallemia ichthyophaga EXF-994]